MDTDLALRIGTVCISLVALIVSLTVAWSNRKTLNVVISENLEVVKGGSVFFIDQDGQPMPYGDCLVSVIEVVNPSPKDIAFFDLRAFNPNTNINVSLLTKRAMFDTQRDKVLWRAIENSNDNVDLMEQVIPETNYGIFKSNSFTRFHIIIFPKKEDHEVALSFKVAMKAKVKDQFAVTSRKKFKFFGRRYLISNWTEGLQSTQIAEQEEISQKQ